VRIYNPRSYSLQTWIELAREEMKVEEQSADALLKDLFVQWCYKYLNLQRLKRRLVLIKAAAILRGVVLEEDKQGKTPEEVETKKPYRQFESIAEFPSPENLKWEEVSMSFISNETLKIRARGQTKRYHYNQLGFQDKRQVDTPNKLWLMLKGIFASEYGRLAYERTNLDISLTRKAQKTISRLRDLLKTIMGIEEDPFYPYRQKNAYTPRFSITDETLTDSTRDNLQQDVYESEGTDAEIGQLIEDESNRGFFADPSVRRTSPKHPEY